MKKSALKCNKFGGEGGGEWTEDRKEVLGGSGWGLENEIGLGLKNSITQSRKFGSITCAIIPSRTRDAGLRMT